MSGWRVLSLPQWSWSADIKQKIDGEISLSLYLALSPSSKDTLPALFPSKVEGSFLAFFLKIKGGEGGAKGTSSSMFMTYTQGIHPLPSPANKGLGSVYALSTKPHTFFPPLPLTGAVLFAFGITLNLCVQIFFGGGGYRSLSMRCPEKFTKVGDTVTMCMFYSWNRAAEDFFTS